MPAANLFHGHIPVNRLDRLAAHRALRQSEFDSLASGALFHRSQHASGPSISATAATLTPVITSAQGMPLIFSSPPLTMPQILTFINGSFRALRRHWLCASIILRALERREPRSASFGDVVGLNTFPCQAGDDF